jgi:thiamine pyrophosphate-dependent acetolactate synthase large subunit-like protein
MPTTQESIRTRTSQTGSKNADVLVMVGARLSEMPSSSYSLNRRKRTSVHVQFAGTCLAMHSSTAVLNSEIARPSLLTQFVETTVLKKRTFIGRIAQ